MTKETPTKSKVPINLVTLEKGLKLAESWVNNMSGSIEDEPAEVEFVGRPPRLGLGAKFVHQPRLDASADPGERRLFAKLEAGKRRAARSLEESNPSERNGQIDEDNSDDELESRTKAFTKKRVNPIPPSLQGNKKKK